MIEFMFSSCIFKKFEVKLNSHHENLYEFLLSSFRSFSPSPNFLGSWVVWKGIMLASITDFQEVMFTVATHKNPLSSYSSMLNKIERLVVERKQNKEPPENIIKYIDEVDIDYFFKPSFKETQPHLTFLATGSPISSGVATGKAYFSLETAKQGLEKKEKVILIKNKLTNDDLTILGKVEAVCCFQEDPSTHASIVIKVSDKPFITYIKPQDIELQEGSDISVDAFNGRIFKGIADIVVPEKSKTSQEIMNLLEELCPLKIYGNADMPAEAKIAKDYGASGISQRTEHMFFSPEKLDIFREIILSASPKARRQALDKLIELQSHDFYELFLVMKGLPIVTRLLDPPLHEFMPSDAISIKILSQKMGISESDLAKKINELHEVNPMMGHRGVRLLITYPEIANAQAKSLFRAMKKAKKHTSVNLKINIPIVIEKKEILSIKKILKEAFEEEGGEAHNLAYQVGIMVETPRAALLSEELASEIDFACFGTNDLTAQTFAFSRGDIYGKFLSHYLDSSILQNDPFIMLDTAVKKLIAYTIQTMKKINPEVVIGLCGEQGADRESAEFLYQEGIDYISCNPSSIPKVKLYLIKKIFSSSFEESNISPNRDFLPYG